MFVPGRFWPAIIKMAFMRVLDFKHEVTAPRGGDYFNGMQHTRVD